ncbi:cytidine and deoxycytidylate deaminase zinc-binding region [Colletotrichum graminicola]|uniref:Cytidine and deoxycytidylate deaminase zinc-binding region n=1 Tax=Colletotrichum graminicola (strain M1.001 / M2 / FGSC 10212) TaxID=645133 RepID=E3QUX7_COLGM|nr:cytidine and deoxycytidylate deaminase zinc-binding region [Colletotrichum graminicola M1.001]EFQ34665.1 cytidine and deoxycytidylate deaminase zinc-binding region [Colletotrichum graminicola M1.001]WDK22826.1 cytidine and deoxycytidylate deaminase zinc-binding region [Colletotrichum graminicola]
MADEALPPRDPETILSALLSLTEDRIVPLTRRGVSSGSKLFGAAILSSTTLEALTVATNDERASPLLHGEINCIQQFFTDVFPDPATRPSPRTACVFFATHEPCSLCLSGIAWSGFREVYYLFTYEDSRDLFAIPHDIDILDAVFRVRAEGEPDDALARRPLYNRANKFFTARSLADLVADLPEGEPRARWVRETERVKGLYNALSDTYQEGKKAGATSSSVWK